MNEESIGQSIPWQRRSEIGLFKALCGTVRQVLFRPGDFFGILEPKSYLEPFYFYFIIGATVSFVVLFLEVLLKKTQNFFVSLIFLPFQVALAIYICSAFMHLFVMLYRCRGGVRETFAIFAYSSAASIFVIIPVVGPIVAAVWEIVISIIGFKRIHDLTTFRAVMVYFSAFIVIIIISMAAAIVIPNFSPVKAAVSGSPAILPQALLS